MDLPIKTIKSLTPHLIKDPLSYDLPKPHKDGILLRHFVIAVSALTSQLAKYLTALLSSIKNSAEFVKILQGVKQPQPGSLSSFNVVFLFTKVSLTETLELLAPFSPCHCSPFPACINT